MYLAGGDGDGKYLFKWCFDEATFEDMAPMTLSRKQYATFISKIQLSTPFNLRNQKDTLYYAPSALSMIFNYNFNV